MRPRSIYTIRHVGALKIFESPWVRPGLVFPIVAATGRSDDCPVYTLCNVYVAPYTHLVWPRHGRHNAILHKCDVCLSLLRIYEQPKRRAADQNLLCSIHVVYVWRLAVMTYHVLYSHGRGLATCALCTFAVPFSLVVYSTFSEWDFINNMQAYCWTPIMKWTQFRWR